MLFANMFLNYLVSPKIRLVIYFIHFQILCLCLAWIMILTGTKSLNYPRLRPKICQEIQIYVSKLWFFFFFLAVPLVMLWPLGFIFPPLGRVLTPMLGPTDLMLSCLSRRTPRSAPFLRVESWWSPYKHTYTTHKKTHMDAFFTQNNHRHTAIVHTQMLTHIHTHTHIHTRLMKSSEERLWWCILIPSQELPAGLSLIPMRPWMALQL